MELNARAAADNVAKEVVDRADAVGLGNNVHVVEESEHMLVWAQPAVNFVEAVVLSQSEHHRHQWIPLFSSFGLHHKM